MPTFSGLKFEKFDLHVHTPASHDFKDKSITAEDVVNEAIKKGLRGIAITDHNTGAWVDSVINTAKGKPLIVFPGVEIYCTGGKSGIHIIGILSQDKNSKHIEAILSNLGIKPEEYGTEKAVSHKGPYDVIDVITKQYNGIAVLAHCTSSKGVLHDITGETRTKIFMHPGLLAVESSKHDFTDEKKVIAKTRAIDLLSGEDANYNFRRLGVYISSDSRVEGEDEHTLKALGAKFTYFKVDENVTLESLRQCFIDREVRIRQEFEYKENSFPHIKKIEITGGFFDSKKATFHNGLNCILGGKGAGKSLLVELMRFGLGKESENPDILNDHNGKLQKKLETYGSLSIEFEDETGVTHNVIRTFDRSKSNPFGDSSHLNLTNSFPILFLSQNEIIKIAEDETEQIKFIDKFFDFRTFQNNIRNIESDLKELDRLFANSLQAYTQLNLVKKDLEAQNVDLEKINKQLENPIYNKYKEIESKNNALISQKNYLTEIFAQVVENLENLNNFSIPSFTSTISEDPIIKRNNDTIKNSIAKAKEHYENALTIIKTDLNSIDTEIKKWNTSFEKEKLDYEKYIRESGGDKKDLESKRLRLVKANDDLKKRISSLNLEANKLKQLKTKREEKIKELFAAYSSYSQERKNKCQKFQDESYGRLKVTIHESTNTQEFKDKLSSLKTGSHFRGSEIDSICTNIRPYDFVLDLLRYEAKKDVSVLDTIATKTGIELDRIKTLCEFLLTQVDIKELLRLQYHAHPQDQPEIQFRLNDGSYEVIKNISTGQKCTAMLIMALSDGNFPIVIDQPEDSLDVRSIWDDMCQKIRTGKNKRQFIFTTHNSALAVASDTDKYIVIECNLNKGEIIHTGAIDDPTIKEQVINYLEGGKKTYSKKADKYGDSIKN